MTITRRNFISKAATGAIGLSGIPLIAERSLKDHNSHDVSKHLINKQSTILFQGDSITDARRNRKKHEANDALAFGTGFAFIISSALLHDMPSYQLKFYNRGVGGNKVFQLHDRWEEDCIKLKPDIISILIGVNDYWHTIDDRFTYDGDLDKYKKDYHKLIEGTKQALPDVNIIICEPFTVLGDVVNPEWQKGFNPYRKAAGEIAREFNLLFIPYQKIFDEACQKVSSRYWSKDGIHPTMAGCQLMAEAWMKLIK